MSPKQAQKDICTHIFREISNSFATGLLEDPVDGSDNEGPHEQEQSSICSDSMSDIVTLTVLRRP